MEKGFNKLKTGVFIENRLNAKDLEQLLQHRRTSTLTLTGLKLKSLEFLLEQKELADLRLYNCTIEDATALQQLKKLKKLFINGVRKENDNFSFLSSLAALADLGIGYASYLSSFPDLSSCTHLRRVGIFNCKHLTDISKVATIPNLRVFGIVDTPQQPRDLEFIMQKPDMESMSAAFGTAKADSEFKELLKKYKLQYG